MKSKLAVGINVYNDTPGLKRCIDSLYEYVDLIIVIDGKYPSWGTKDDPPLSNDGLRDMIAEYTGRKENPASKIIRVDMPNKEQYEKRTKYLEIAGEYNCTHLLVIDADEYIQPGANWRQFRSRLDLDDRFEYALADGGLQYSHNINYQATPDHHLSLARLIYKPGDLYYRSHWHLFRKSDGKLTTYQDVGDIYVVHGITITTDDLTRPMSRIESDIDYQWDLFLLEGHINKDKHDNPAEKKVFADHIIWEVNVWKEYKNKQ